MHNLIILSVYVVSLKHMFAHPLPSARTIFPDGRSKMALDSVRNAFRPKAPGSTRSSGPESMHDLPLDKDEVDIFMYTGRVISTLNSDPRYAEMSDKLKNPESKCGLPDLLGAMSTTTLTKLDKIKAEEHQKYLKKCESQKEGTEPPKPDYLDLQDPEKFSLIDFNLVIIKIASMRSAMEKFLGGDKMN